MKLGHCILNDDGSITEVDIETWAKWFETAERHIGLDKIGDVTVSTVFLGIDHNWSNQGPPLIFETMIFGGPHDQYQERYATKDEAISGHKKAVDMVKRGSENSGE